MPDKERQGGKKIIEKTLIMILTFILVILFGALDQLAGHYLSLLIFYPLSQKTTAVKPWMNATVCFGGCHT